MSYSVDSYHAMQDRVAALEDRVSERDTKIAELRAALAKAEAERDALKARAERLSAECRIVRQMDEIESGAGLLEEGGWYDLLADRRAARAAVDAHGDLEVTR